MRVVQGKSLPGGWQSGRSLGRSHQLGPSFCYAAGCRKCFANHNLHRSPATTAVRLIGCGVQRQCSLRN